jgi:hypothetical protein
MSGMGGMDHGQHGGSPPAPKSPPTLGSLLTSPKPMDPNGIDVLRRIMGGFCKNCTVIAGKITIVFENGTRADITQGVSKISNMIYKNISNKIALLFLGLPSPRSRY